MFFLILLHYTFTNIIYGVFYTFSREKKLQIVIFICTNSRQHQQELGNIIIKGNLSALKFWLIFYQIWTLNVFQSADREIVFESLHALWHLLRIISCEIMKVEEGWNSCTCQYIALDSWQSCVGRVNHAGV